METSEIVAVRLSLSKKDQIRYLANKIQYNKKLSHFFSKARKRAKREKCYTCEKESSSFCNSHSVPQFCLKRIAIDGKVYFSGNHGSIPFLGDDNGVKDAGTFQLICRQCDNVLFRDYEMPETYNNYPSGKVLAQIVMKNYLQMISKRLLENSLYTILEEQSPQNKDYAKVQKRVIELDLIEYANAYKRARIAAEKSHDDWYYLCYYKCLDYVVPYAMQGPAVMICDLEGNIINDVYNMSPDYHTKEIHLAVFPLKHTSVILMIIDSRDKKYRCFYRQLKKLPLDDQLATINYIIHLYCENVFLSKSIDEAVLNDEKFLDVCQRSSVLSSSTPLIDAVAAATAEFNLSRRNEIPNLLDKKYALSTSQ